MKKYILCEENPNVDNAYSSTWPLMAPPTQLGGQLARIVFKCPLCQL